VGESAEEEDVAITEAERVSGQEAEGNVEQLVRKGMERAVAKAGWIPCETLHYQRFRVLATDDPGAGQDGEKVVHIPIVERSVLVKYQRIADGAEQRREAGDGEGQIPFAGQGVQGRAGWNLVAGSWRRRASDEH